MTDWGRIGRVSSYSKADQVTEAKKAAFLSTESEGKRGGKRREEKKKNHQRHPNRKARVKETVRSKGRGVGISVERNGKDKKKGVKTHSQQRGKLRGKTPRANGVSERHSKTREELEYERGKKGRATK